MTQGLRGRPQGLRGGAGGSGTQHGHTAPGQASAGVSGRTGQMRRQASVGGPRPGGGAALRHASAMEPAWAASACGGVDEKSGDCAAGGGAPVKRHSAQSKLCVPWMAGAPVSASTSMTMPAAEHTKRLPWACASGAAVASPSARHHHSNTARASVRVVRRNCKGDMEADYGSRGLLSCAHAKPVPPCHP